MCGIRKNCFAVAVLCLFVASPSGAQSQSTQIDCLGVLDKGIWDISYSYKTEDRVSSFLNWLNHQTQRRSVTQDSLAGGGQYGLFSAYAKENHMNAEELREFISSLSTGYRRYSATTVSFERFASARITDLVETCLQSVGGLTVYPVHSADPKAIILKFEYREQVVGAQPYVNLDLPGHVTCTRTAVQLTAAGDTIRCQRQSDAPADIVIDTNIVQKNTSVIGFSAVTRSNDGEMYADCVLSRGDYIDGTGRPIQVDDPLKLTICIGGNHQSDTMRFTASEGHWIMPETYKLTECKFNYENPQPGDNPCVFVRGPHMSPVGRTSLSVGYTNDSHSVCVTGEVAQGRVEYKTELTEIARDIVLNYGRITSIQIPNDADEINLSCKTVEKDLLVIRLDEKSALRRVFQVGEPSVGKISTVYRLSVN